MSRVSEALSRAGAAPPIADPVQELDHPWGIDLGERPKPRVNPPRPVEAVNRPALVPVVPADEPLRDGASGPVLARFSPEMRHQLAGLVESVFLPASRQPPHRVGFSAIDGGTFSGAIAAAAAELLAERTSATVCVVDAHLAAPTVHALFGVPNAAGLPSAAGVSPSDRARRVGRNLWLVSAAVDGTGGQVTDMTRTQLTKCMAQFEYALVNIEPIGSHGEGGGLATLMDAVILVIDAETTRREAGRRVAEGLRGAGLTVLGAVMANRHFPIPEQIYRRL